MRKRMNMLELYEHVRTVGVGALIAAAILVAVGIVIPLLPASPLFSPLSQSSPGNAAARYVPTPRPRPPYQHQSERADRAETAMLSNILVAERWPSHPAREPEIIPPLNLAPLTDHLTREAVRDIKNKRETSERTREQATCRAHGLRTVWEGRYRWRCRR